MARAKWMALAAAVAAAAPAAGQQPARSKEGQRPGREVLALPAIGLTPWRLGTGHGAGAARTQAPGQPAGPGAPAMGQRAAAAAQPGQAAQVDTYTAIIGLTTPPAAAPGAPSAGTYPGIIPLAPAGTPAQMATAPQGAYQAPYAGADLNRLLYRSGMGGLMGVNNIVSTYASLDQLADRFTGGAGAYGAPALVNPATGSRLDFGAAGAPAPYASAYTPKRDPGSEGPTILGQPEIAQDARAGARQAAPGRRAEPAGPGPVGELRLPPLALPVHTAEFLALPYNTLAPLTLGGVAAAGREAGPAPGRSPARARPAPAGAREQARPSSPRR